MTTPSLLAGVAEGESVEAQATISSEANSRQERERSSIEFPYGDLNEAITVVRAINDKLGSSCTPDQLASALGHDSVSSGRFRHKLSTARIFGLIEVTRDLISITALGHQIVNPEQERAARADAFLRVPLYSALYEQYKGYLLPPTSGLEQAMVVLGVSSKQKDKARQAFQRSAEQAGFFALGRNRLVMPPGLSGGSASATSLQTARPAIGVPPLQSRPLDQQAQQQGGASYGDGGVGLPPGTDPLVVGLIRRLPSAGESWPANKQDEWLALARQIFRFVYGGDSTESPHSVGDWGIRE